MKERTTRSIHVAATAMLAIATTFCGGMDEMEASSESTTPLTQQSVRGTGPFTVRDGDLMFKVDRRQLEILSINVRGGVGTGTSVFKSASSVDEYKCDNDPPQQDDSCTCGGHTGPGSGVLNILDCAFLKIDCADGKFSGDTCSDWDGDPLPP